MWRAKEWRKVVVDVGALPFTLFDPAASERGVIQRVLALGNGSAGSLALSYGSGPTGITTINFSAGTPNVDLDDLDWDQPGAGDDLLVTSGSNLNGLIVWFTIERAPATG